MRAYNPKYKIKNYDRLVRQLKQTEKKVESPAKQVSDFAHALDTICLNLIKKKGIKST